MNQQHHKMKQQSKKRNIREQFRSIHQFQSSSIRRFIKDFVEIERDNESPPSSPARPISRCSNSDIFSNLRPCDRSNTSTSSLNSQLQQSQHHHEKGNANNSAAAVAAQAHFNGTMQGIMNLQKLQQNIATMQQHPQIPAGLSGLQGLPNLSATAINSPLNLSVVGGSQLPSGSGLPNLASGLNLNTNQMPQLILASGQLVQGIQGAQLLIPTSQGIATQTILTIPVSQQINTNEQLVQSLAAMNGIGGSSGGNSTSNNPTSLATQLNQGPNLLSPHMLSSSVQQLLSAIQPHIFPPPSQHNIQQQQQASTHQTSANVIPSQTNNLQQMSSASPSRLIGRTLSGAQTPKSSPPRIASASSISSVGSSQHHDQQSNQRHHPYDKVCTTTTSTTSSHSLHTSHYTMNGHSQLSTSPHLHSQHREQTRQQHLPQMQHQQQQHHHQNLVNRGHSPTSLAINSINRLASTNGEITITKSHGQSPSLGSSSSSSSHRSTNIQLVPQIKLSPSSIKMSPTESECSRNDLLDDNPNEPTINQTNCNVVDGIDLDEIKEFAKAFKLRRLSLGLTQTQVGQALSVTEGPAYSQSAICSALAAQMYAAQLSSQQQAMFEKLDITPKSAQKIKPVLERWMKEAEERYKSGQNHLTEFIGVEPSKKRKRRTSFTPQALELLNAHFERNTHPSGTEITGLAHQLGYEREVIRIWFCNKRQALKNTVRMMSKGMV